MQEMCNVLFFLLVLGACSQAVRAEGQKCTSPPLWIFATSEDIRFIFEGIEFDLILVDNGVINEVLTNQLFATSILHVFEDIEEIPLTWCILSREVRSIEYSFALESDNTAILEHPVFTVPPRGSITTTAYRFRAIFRCLPSNRRSTIGLTFSINTTSPTGEEYCPIKFFFGKMCPRQGSTYGSGELPTTLEALGITDGFLNNSVLNIKPTESIHTPPTLLIRVLSGVLVPLCVLSVVALVIGVLVWALWYRKSKSKIAEFRPDAVSNAYREVYSLAKLRDGHEKEFPHKKLTIVRDLGEGAFGVVLQAQAEGIVEGEEFTNVAVKQLHAGSSEMDEFFREVDFMSGLDHPNVVKLLGVCSVEEPFSMIFEYMDLGDLCGFLREAIGLGKDIEGDEENEGMEDDTPTEPLLTNEELLSIVLQVADGMAYISSKHLVHRDLAARNCLVATGLVVKIADFGMSRNIDISDYYRCKGSALLPVRWMPPESILYGKFTVESDIWAFGILLWEVFTFGQQPYFGIEDTEVITRIKACNPPDPPAECPAHQLMQQCWNRNPKKRPSFEECKRQIEQLLSTEK